jgi:hypothetical protein
MPLNPNDTLANSQYCILRLPERGGLGFVYQATLLSAARPSPGKSRGLVGDSAGAFDDVEGLAREVSQSEIRASLRLLLGRKALADRQWR